MSGPAKAHAREALVDIFASLQTAKRGHDAGTVSREDLLHVIGDVMAKCSFALDGFTNEATATPPAAPEVVTVKCPDCDGRGWNWGGFWVKGCASCDGTGTRPAQGAPPTQRGPGEKTEK